MAGAPQASGPGRPRVMIAGTRFGYPYGSGAASRVTAYAKGLQEAGTVAHVVSMLTPDRHGPGLNTVAAGVHDGVSYEYACGTRTRASSFVGRRLLEARVPLGVWRAARCLFRGATGPRAVIAYTTEPWRIALLALVAKATGAVCLVELCEMPFVYETDTRRRALGVLLQDAIAYRLVDGFLVISTELETYVRRHAPPSVPILGVPILVAPEEFDVSHPLRDDGRPRRLVYVGDLGHEGEADDLMRAFALVAPTCDDVQLVLAGPLTEGDRAKLEARAAALGLEGRVWLPGYVARERLPELLAGAAALVLLRRAAAFSRAGLPTKLAEYLASGRPVVVTGIGDVSRYLRHGIDAYLAPPGDVTAFADLLRCVLDDESGARAVGARGRQAAKRSFDRAVHGARLAAFVADVFERARRLRAHPRVRAGDDV